MKSKTFFRILGALLAMVMVLSLTAITACAAEATLNKTSMLLVQGQTSKLKVKGASEVVWTSSDEAVVTVDEKGNVTGVSMGTANVYANADGEILKCKVTVTSGKIEVDNEEVNINAGGTAAVVITSASKHDLVFKSSNAKVATASWNGSKFKNSVITLTITGVSAGTAQIKVYSKSNPTTMYKYIIVNVTDGSKDSSGDNVQGVISYINKQRTDAGVAALSVNGDLSKAAESFGSKLEKGGRNNRAALRLACSNFGINKSSVQKIVLTTSSDKVSASEPDSSEVLVALSGSMTYLDAEYTDIGAAKIKSDAGYIWVIILM